MAKFFLDEFVQVLTTEADTRAYDIIEKKNRQVIKSTNTLGISFKKVFGYLGAYFGTRALVRYADEWKNIDSILKLVTSDEMERLELQNKIFDISQRTRQEMAGTVDLYRRITTATTKLGVSEADRLKVTEAINKSLLIGGGSSSSNMAALVQLGQGLSADALRGQELNSILEQSPRLAKAIAEGLGMQVGDLRTYAEKNKGIRAEQVLGAILSQAEAINAEFGNINITVGQSITQFNNSFGRFISRVDKSAGITDTLAKTIGIIANFFDKSATSAALLVKYAKQLFILFLAIRAISFASIPFQLFLLNLKEGVGVLMAFKNVLLALNLKGLIASSWALLAPWLKLLAVAIAIKEIWDTLQGKDTFLRDASESLGDNYNNRVAKDYEDIFNTLGDGWLGKAGAAIATPYIAGKNAIGVGYDKLLGKTQNNNVTINVSTAATNPAGIGVAVGNAIVDAFNSNRMGQ